MCSEDVYNILLLLATISHRNVRMHQATTSADMTLMYMNHQILMINFERNVSSLVWRITILIGQRTERVH